MQSQVMPTLGMAQRLDGHLDILLYSQPSVNLPLGARNMAMMDFSSLEV